MLASTNDIIHVSVFNYSVTKSFMAEWLIGHFTTKVKNNGPCIYPRMRAYRYIGIKPKWLDLRFFSLTFVEDSNYHSATTT